MYCNFYDIVKNEPLHSGFQLKVIPNPFKMNYESGLSKKILGNYI